MSIFDVHTICKVEPFADLLADRGAAELLQRAIDAATTLRRVRQGSMSSGGFPALRILMQEYGAIANQLGRVAAYLRLMEAAALDGPRLEPLRHQLDEAIDQVEAATSFVLDEWLDVDDRVATELLAPKAAAPWRAALQCVRSPSLEPDEGVRQRRRTAEHAYLTAGGALFVRDAVDGSPTGVEAALGRLEDPDPAVRAEVGRQISMALQEGLGERVAAYRTVVEATTQVSPQLWTREISDLAGIDDDALTGAMAQIRDAYALSHRWYRRQARALGRLVIADHDRAAHADYTPAIRIPWKTGLEIALAGLSHVDADLGGAAARFAAEGWIDHQPRSGKRVGAFCDYTVSDHHPYVVMTWDGRERDVLSLAHELAHGAHAYLAREQGHFGQAPPLLVAETVALLAELAAAARIAQAFGGDAAQRQFELSVESVFWQAAVFAFEQDAHAACRAGDRLDGQRLAEMWCARQAEMLGPSVALTTGFGAWWSFLPHLVTVPGYACTYALGSLLAVRLSERIAREPPGSAPLGPMLRAGGTVPTAELLALAGCDVASAATWQAGLAAIERRLDDLAPLTT